MVAVKTGLTTPPPMPGMPAPMQPMMPMGGPGTFPAAPLPAGQTPVPPSMPPLPLAGFPPPPVKPPMAQPSMPQQQQGSNAPRRKRFGDSLEGMLGRNMFAPQQQRPLPIPQQQQQRRMVAPGTPMMRTPPMGRGMPRPMNQGGIVQYMDEGGLAILTLPDGNAYIDFGGGAYHHVSPNEPGQDVIASLQSAYGDRIGEVRAADQGEQDFIFGKVDYGKGQNLTEDTTVIDDSTVTDNTGVNNSNTAVVDNSGIADTSAQSAAMSAPVSFDNAALFGPVVRDTPSYSQFVQNPTTGGITTTGGNTMTAVSPIGSIDLPAAPVDIDIYDYLADPVFGSMSPVIRKEMGGAVPRQTSIAGQPHGLAYINQDEEALLRSFGGSGIAGPGGIPSYPPTGVTSGGGASDAPKTFDSGYKPITTNYKAGSPDDDDDKPSSIGPSGYTSLDAIAAAAEETPSDKMDFGDDENYTPTSTALNAQLSGLGQTNITSDTSNVNFGATSSGKDFDTAAKADTDVSGAEFVAAGGLGIGDSGTPTNIAPISLGSDDPVVFTDIMGNTYSNIADRDRANLGYQQASYQQGSQALRGTLQGFKQFGDFDSDEEAYRRGAANFAVDPPENLSVYNLQNTPDIFTNMFPPQRPILPPKIGSGDDKDDKSTSDDGTSTVSNLLDLEPAEGGYSLVDLKKGISLAEGTSDAGGYDRLLGYQEDNFNVKPTEMTVQEIIDFQDSKGPYAEYSRAINKKLGKVNPDGTGVISTPVGKYQIVGSTMKGLIRAGVLDPNEKFNVNAQERAANHLITKDLFIVDPDTKKKTYNIGLRDVKTGNITSDQFEEALINQFEGLGDKNLNDLINKANEGDTPGVIPASATSDTQAARENDLINKSLKSGSATETNIFDPIDPQDKGKEKEYQFNLNLGGSDKEKDKNKELPPFIPAEKVEQITSYTNKDGKTTVDNPKTPQNEAVIAQLGLGSSLADVAATGRDIGVPNAAESAFLMEALNEMEFDDKGNLVGADPNFFEETVGKIIKNLTLGAFDPNDPQKREDALAILDNYQKTGKFVYDTEELSVSEIAKRLKEQGEKGLEPAVIGVKGADKTTVGFDDGTGFRNIMGDYNPVYKDGQVFSGGSDTQNILTGSTDVFGGDNTSTITTGGDDGGDSGSDTTTGGPGGGYIVDKDGNIICNREGYIYNPETKECEPEEEEKEEEKDLSINVVRGEDFDDVLKRVVTAAPSVGSIAGNVQTMQEGGMAGLNRAADNFLQALAG